MGLNGVSTRARGAGNATEHNGLDLELLFLTEVVGLTSLHYGYWDEPPTDEDLSIAGLKDAQARFTERLLALIPSDVKSVLDVGSGVGDNSAEMVRRGYDVTALSPDRNHLKFYDRMKSEGMVFHNERFEDLECRRRFDLILMSESQNYFEPSAGLQAVQRHLNPRGHLLIAGMFRKTDSREFNAVRCVEQPYIDAAAKYGFHLEQAIDVTENVLPTIRLAERYLKPFLRLAQHYFESGSFLKRWLVSLLIAKRKMNPRRLREYYEQWVSPDFYRAHIKYEYLLFRRQG